MEKRVAFCVLKALVAAYIVTGLLLDSAYFIFDRAWKCTGNYSFRTSQHTDLPWRRGNRRISVIKHTGNYFTNGIQK